MKLDRHTEKAQEAILRAQRLASDANATSLDVEHLLAALLEDDEGVFQRDSATDYEDEEHPVAHILYRLRAAPNLHDAKDSVPRTQTLSTPPVLLTPDVGRFFYRVAFNRYQGGITLG